MSTLSLTPQQWRDLALGNLSRTFEIVKGFDSLNAEGVAFIKHTLAQTAQFVEAWHRASAPAPQVTEPAAPVPHEGVKAHEQAEVAKPEPRKRRSDAGKARGPRKRNNPKLAEATQ